MADPITWGLINGVKKGVKTVQNTLDGLLDDIKDEFDIFIGDAEEVIEKLGTGLPPRDLAAFTSQSTEDGIQLTFTPPAQTYIDDGGTDQFAVMPAGVLIRYSDTGYPRTPDEGVFGYDYKPTGDWVTTSQTCTIVGLTKNTKYYFTAFPYSTEHVYNKNQVTANRTEMTWVGNKGTISVNVQPPSGYTGELGEYTITLLDQSADNPQNEQKTATGPGITLFGSLTGGKQYKVRLSSTDDLQAPADSEVLTVVAGDTVSVELIYAQKVGTITVNVSTQPANMPIGGYTVTLTPQSGGGETLTAQGNNTQSVVFNNAINGVVYNVGLSPINHYTANTNGSVTAVGGQNTQHNVEYGYSATFSESSWEEIQAVAQTGLASNYYSVGDSKVTSSQNFIIIGINRDLSNSITVFAPNNYGTGSYDAFEQTPTVGQTLVSMNGKFGMLPAEVQSVCKQVSKGYYDGHSESSGRPIAGYRTVYFFTLSANEVGLTSYYESINDVSMGTQYPYFSSNGRRIINLNGDAISWYLRSCAQMRDTTGCVTPQGSINSSRNNVYYIGAFIVG